MAILISQSGDTVIYADRIVSFGVQDESYLTRDGLYGTIVSNYVIYVCYGNREKAIGNFCSKEKAMDILKEMTHAIQSGTDYSLPKDKDLE